ncbi:hypothetical protein [Methylobacterium sp. 174MFSha1.1]|uniref:hypothetical protein n=1 Tax=Methylobacterium sp. 174MFSha1.1 TaxID=1502749 RepID=UPI0011605FDE|nr:hypothetical protein [Methylobacterium sp. 174MFSha1.1]
MTGKTTGKTTRLARKYQSFRRSSKTTSIFFLESVLPESVSRESISPGRHGDPGLRTVADSIGDAVSIGLCIVPDLFSDHVRGISLTVPVSWSEFGNIASR